MRRHHEQEQGMTLVEILLGIALASFVVLLAGSGFVFVTRSWYAQQARLEAQQNLRVVVERLVRELRLAGVCLDQFGSTPDVRPIEGTDGGGRDTLVFRANRTCARSALRTAYAGGRLPIQLQSIDGFAVGMQAYICCTTDTPPSGQFFRVLGVQRTGGPGSQEGQLDPDRSLDPYPPDASVVGVETQRYQVEERDGVPELRLEINGETGGQLELLARGIEQFNVRYVLQRAPDGCDGTYEDLCVRDQPDGTLNEWSLVRVVLLEVQARSVRPLLGVGGGEFYRVSQGPLVVRPRNLLHGGD